MPTTSTPDIIFHNGKVTTLDPDSPDATAFAIAGSEFVAVGSNSEVMPLRSTNTLVVDLEGRRVIPGLVDGHIHLIRGGLTYNMELRWDGITSLSDAMQMLRAQVAITPPPQWVRVIGGFSFLQFREKRLPTLAELNEVAPQTPVMILHLYDRAMLNRAALRALGYDKNTPDPKGARIERDKNGTPTGLIVSEPVNTILYEIMDRAPKLEHDDQVNSTKHFMRELNRLGVTGAIDAGGGYNPYPQNYEIARSLVTSKESTIRLAYNLLPQSPGTEMQEFASLIKSVRLRDSDSMFRANGAGEMLVYSAYDFEDFRFARPNLPSNAEADLEPVLRMLAENKWPVRLHATYDETIRRELPVFERVHADIPLNDLHWFFDHAETVSEDSLERIARMGGGIAIQHRMAYQGDFFVERYGTRAVEAAPPVRMMMKMGIPVGAGTDATRVSSHNPWVCIHWLCTGQSVAGTQLLNEASCLERIEALRLWTEANSWFTDEVGQRGRIQAGQYADCAALSADVFHIADQEIPFITADLTVVNGKVVHGTGTFESLAPPLPPASPDWSPVRRWPGYPSQSSHRANVGTGPMAAHRAAPDFSGGCMCWAW